MKFFCAIALVFLAAAVAAKTDDEEWESFKALHGKKHSGREEATRKALFLERHRKIQEHNNKNLGWQMAHNRFSDMTDDERQASLGVTAPIRRQRSTERSAYPIETRALPASIDYRTDSCLQPVKDQGQCGSCWAFATIASLEFNRCKKTGTAVALSEQMLVDCDPYNNGCNGGMYDRAWRFIKEKGGAMKASAYAYTSGTSGAAGTACKFNSTSVAAQVSTYAWTDPYPNATVSMTYLQSNGPLPSAIKVLDSFYSYSSGVYSDSACIVSDMNQIDHAITIVGYGATTATTTSPSVPYWIVRNSWGTGWGISGYFLIKRGVNMCNIEAWTAYVSVV